MIKRILVNTSSNVAQLIVAMVVTFVMAPLYLKLMGHHDYGLREMVMALVGYMGLLDLGMRPTIGRFAAMHNAKSDRESLLVVYASSFAFMSCVGILLACFFFIWAGTFPDTLNPEGAEDSRKYSLFLTFVGAQLLFIFPKFVCESYLEGLQRYYFKNIINILFTILIAVVAYNYMTPENGLVLLVFLGALTTLVKLLIFAAILIRPALGSLYPSWRYFSYQKLREMLSFGLKSFIQGAAGTVEKMSDRLVIGTILGPAAIPVYTIPATLVGYISSITMTLSHTFMPLFSDLSARGQQHRIKAIYLLASKLLVGLITPMGVGICLIGGPFIGIWMEGEFDPVIVDAILVLLVTYTLVPMLNPFASRYLTAINRHVIFAKVAPPAALVNLALSVWLVMEYGVIGAALGSVLPVFVVMPVYLYVVCHNLEISMLHYFRSAVLPALIPVALMGGGLFWFRDSYGFDSYLSIVLAVVVSAIGYSLVYWFFAMGREDREVLLKLLPRAR